jgi:hypothetical protein
MKTINNNTSYTNDTSDTNKKFKINNVNIEDIDFKTYKQNLNVSKEIRYKYGEINTPFSLIESMLDLFDKKVFFDKNKKWLDIGAGCGYFSIVLFNKLYEGLKEVIKNNDERKKHIIKNMIYMAELREENWNILESNNLFTNECNILKGNFLSMNDEYIIEKSGRKFDYIIGNPPYNNDGIKKVPTNKNKGGYDADYENDSDNIENNKDINNKEKYKYQESSTVWIPFIKKSIDLLNNNGQMVVIIPSIWMKPDKAHMYNLLTSYKLEYINCMNNTETNKIFNKCAQTPSCYFKLTKVKYTSNNNMNEINERNVTIYDKHFNSYVEWSILNNNPIPVFGASILKKVFKKIKKNPDNYLIINKTNLPSKKSKFSINKINEYTYPCINTCKLIGENKDIPSLAIEYSNLPQSFYGKPKLVLAHKMYGFPFIDVDGIYGISNRDNYVILNKSLRDMNVLKLFLSTKLVLYLFESTRYRMKYLEKYIFNLIPDITLFEEFKERDDINNISDLDFYTFFNINEDEIKIINNFCNKDYKSF